VLAQLHEAGIPFISILTDPTTGGVTASYAMLGDVHIAEPNALIGFAGPRVIEQTIKQELPDGFQRSEFLLEHGMLDLIVDRREMKAQVARFCATCWACRRRPRPTRHGGGVAAAPCPPTYDALVAELFPRLTGGIRWGLERTRRMLAVLATRTVVPGAARGRHERQGLCRCAPRERAALRRPPRRPLLLAASLHVPRAYPLDGRAIGEDALLAAAQRLWPAIRREEPSFFEATTVIAFLAMAEAGCRHGRGRGGPRWSSRLHERGDPDVVVLTNVSLDHVQLLGPTWRTWPGRRPASSRARPSSPAKRPSRRWICSVRRRCSGVRRCASLACTSCGMWRVASTARISGGEHSLGRPALQHTAPRPAPGRERRAGRTCRRCAAAAARDRGGAQDCVHALARTAAAGAHWRRDVAVRCCAQRGGCRGGW
jgi:hypothetical protein